MMNLWRETHKQTLPVSASALISVLLHAGLISAAVSATQRPPGLHSASELANRPYYVPPPNRVPAQSASVERLEFIALAPQGYGAGFAQAALDVGKKAQVSASTRTPGNAGRNAASQAARAVVASADSVLTEVEVDSAARRDPTSAAPSYPVALLQQGVQGSVAAQYVVDTTGVADVTTLRILHTTHPLFSDAVRAALPFMHFTPARLDGRKVRQLVEQDFSFRIQPPAVVEAARKPVV